MLIPGVGRAFSRNLPMRYVLMHRLHAEGGDMPASTPDLHASVGRLIGDMIQAGVFLDADGLQPTEQRVRLEFHHGRGTLTEGPQSDTHGDTCSLFVLKVPSRALAIEWCQRYGQLIGEGELELCPLVEHWDLGVVPRPPGDVPLRCLVLHRCTAASGACIARDANAQEPLRQLFAEMEQQGVLEFHDGLLPSRDGARLDCHDGQRIVTPGPYAASSQPIDGFTVVQLRTLDEAQEWGLRLAHCLGGAEVDVRRLAEPVGTSCGR